MGYGVISALDKKMELLAFDVLNLKSSSDHADKLKKIFEHTLALIDLYHPDEMALEEPFFGKDVQAMLKLGRAQGVAMAAALSRSIPIFGYSPRRIKKSITGNGNASKEMVAHVLMQLLHFAEVPRYLDATDGLAAAVCHFFQNAPRAQGKQYAGWEAFLKEHPERGRS
jgi:crossover junction endodeoxyribonuclease RuvC